MTPTLRQCLTIAGSDSGGGAGIQADLKAFQANGVFGMSALTSITAQNTQRVTRAYDLPEDLILAQLQAVFEDFTVAAAKTGMLSSKSIVSTISAFWRSLGPAAPPLVVDPVMISKSGYPLLLLDAVARVRKELLPLAFVVTPNRHEAELLSGVSLGSRDEVETAGWKILALGPRTVLLKGGHLDGKGLDPSLATDYLFQDGKVREFSSPRVETTSTHGTGCTLSAAITAWIGRGYTVAEAVDRSRRYVDGALRCGLDIGHGYGPLHHFFFMTDWTTVAGGVSPRDSVGRKAGTTKVKAARAATAAKKAGAAGRAIAAGKANAAGTAGTTKTAKATKPARPAKVAKVPARKAATRTTKRPAARKTADGNVAARPARVTSARRIVGATRRAAPAGAAKKTRPTR